MGVEIADRRRKFRSNVFFFLARDQAPITKSGNGELNCRFDLEPYGR